MYRIWQKLTGIFEMHRMWPMTHPELFTTKDAQLENWRSSQLSTVVEPKSMNFNRFLVSIDHPGHLSGLLGYIEVETLVKNSGGLHIPLRLPDFHPLHAVAKQNAERFLAMHMDTVSSKRMKEAFAKPAVNSKDLADIYTAFGFPVTLDQEKGFYPQTVQGFNLNFEGISTGAVSLWMYKFRDSWKNEYTPSERFDPDHTVWIQSAQGFYDILTHALPLAVKPADVQMLRK